MDIFIDKLKTLKRFQCGNKKVIPEAVRSDRPTIFQLLTAGYHWCTWGFIVVMVFSQFLSVVWDTTKTKTPQFYGRSPVEGPMQITGFNDIPFPDRVIVCVKEPNTDDIYEPWQVSSLIAANKVNLVDSTGTSKTGYRLVARDPTITPLVLDAQATETYYRACSLIAKTIDNIVGTCSKLGYTNITTDMMRILPSADSNDLYEIPDSLPLVIMPYWDNAPAAREAMPTWDGDACIFRLEEAYVSDLSSIARFRGVNQSVRHDRTIDWLNVGSTGEWRNGWYEDPTGMRWYSDVVSSFDDPVYHMMHRQFDMRTGKEDDCFNTDVCRSSTPIPSYWGPKTFTYAAPTNINSVYAANGTQYGVFLYQSMLLTVVGCHYDWETFLSNASIGLLLARWMYSMLALHRGFFQHSSQWHSGGIGCISSARSFNMLPFAVLPHLKPSLEAFWTVGCQFEGQQRAMSESWFAIYPSIVEIMLVYYSLLNTLAAVFRRRMSDALFAPSIIVLCLLHYFRLQLAESGKLSGVDGRVATAVSSDEVGHIRLVDFFSSDIALRINGNVRELFIAKLAILGASLLPLLLARPIPVVRRHSELLGGIEKSLALRAQHVGGLANSHDYVPAGASRHMSSLRSFVLPDERLKSFQKALRLSSSDRTASKPKKGMLLNGYQLVRLNYLVLGGKYLITFEDWDIISLMAPLRSLHNLWNQRIFVWQLRDSTEFAGKELDSEFPEVWRVDDPRLTKVPFWHISACDIRCGTT